MACVAPAWVVVYRTKSERLPHAFKLVVTPACELDVALVAVAVFELVQQPRCDAAPSGVGADAQVAQLDAIADEVEQGVARDRSVAHRREQRAPLRALGESTVGQEAERRFRGAVQFHDPTEFAGRGTSMMVVSAIAQD